MSDLNQRERNVLRKFVTYNDQLEQNNYGYWRWGNAEAGDSAVKVGNVILSLIDKGYLEAINIGIPKIRATKKSKNLYCYRCNFGRVYNNDGHQIGTCTHCDGKGMLEAAKRQGGE